MSILSKVKSGRVPRAQKVVIYAPEGFGKSTLASQFPQPLFLDVEDSTAQMDVTRLGRDDLGTIKHIEQAIAAVIAEKPCRTLVLDTADWLEQMIVDQMIKDAGSDKIQGIEDFGYGKGYTALREQFTLLLARLDHVLQEGINVVFLAHSQVKKHEPPDGAGPYDRYELKLSKQVAPLIKEWADMVLFGNWRTQVKERDPKKEAGAQFKAVGGRERLMHCNRAAAWDAKNRHGLKDQEVWSIDTIRGAFATVGAPWGEPLSTAPAVAAKAAPVVAKPETAPARNGAQGEPATAEAGPLMQHPPVSSPPVAADPLPGVDAPEHPDPELEALLLPHEAAVNAYLIGAQKIGRHQSFRSMPADYRARVLKNPAGFLARVQADTGRAAA